MKPNPTQPFFSFRFNWLVIGLPLIAVVASFITLFLALSHPDPVLKVSKGSPEERPAVEGRNHATTGGKRPQ
ncbi:MAG: hypothetical protein ACK5O3_02735 [Burkholderiales bacterium]|jgi:hypothetical protein